MEQAPDNVIEPHCSVVCLTCFKTTQGASGMRFQQKLLAPGAISALLGATIGILLCFLASTVAAQDSDADNLHAGPLFDKFDLTLATGQRTEAAGPFYYSEQHDTQHTWGMPPLFVYDEDPATESEKFIFAYPLISYIRYGSQSRLQFGQLLSFGGGSTQQETNRQRVTVFPFFFLQRSPLPSESYVAVLPFYGHLKNRLFRDEVFWIMFPFYIQSRKADVVTDNYVYPFYDVRRGNGLHGWQFWPFYGTEHKDVTTKTNGFGDIQTIGGHDNLFVLWPFYFQQKAGIGTDNPEWTEGSIPAFALSRSPKRDSTTVLWPFFSRIDDRERKYREWELPWPFVVFARGEGKTAARVFPFYGRAHSAFLESDFYMWPVYKYNRVHGESVDRSRTRIFFFLYSDVRQKNPETGAALHRVDFWPLYTYHRELNGNTRLQVLALLEPFLPQSTSVEREYAPLWSLWRAERNPKTGAASQSLLWNLYRHETTPRSEQRSLFFGLYQSRSDADGKHVRLCYIPLKK
jgi:hypothetical protein